MIGETGLQADIPEAEYHADPALSQSAVKVLLDCPARYKWQLDNPPEPKTAFEVGSAAHSIVLGVGLPIVVVQDGVRSASEGAKDYRTKAAQAHRDEIREAGQIPVLRQELDEVNAMAEAILSHPLARAILERDGDSELSAWWTDVASDGTEIRCRGRFDRVTTTLSDQPALVDVKTAAKPASPESFRKSVIDFAYDLQSDWYSTGFELITGQRPSFVFIVVEKNAPHLVGVHALDEKFAERGRRLRIAGLDRYAACMASDEWPGHGNEIHLLTPPAWAS